MQHVMGLDRDLRQAERDGLEAAHLVDRDRAHGVDPRDSGNQLSHRPPS